LGRAKLVLPPETASGLLRDGVHETADDVREEFQGRPLDLPGKGAPQGPSG
jgi:hypothetical protein